MGRFFYQAATDTWQWSDEVFKMLGFAVNEVVPTTALLIAHQHPQDRPGTVDEVLMAVKNGEPFASRHRIIDTRQVVRMVISTGEAVRSDDGVVLAVRGVMVDVTESLRRDLAESTQAAVEASGASRAVIDQAKGALMLVYGMDEDAAFGLLRWYSQRSNVKLRVLAEQLVAATTQGGQLSRATRRGMDEVFFALTTGPADDRRSAAATPAVDLITGVQVMDGAVVLTVAGEIDLATGPQFTAALAAAIGQAQSSGRLVVDLSEVRHLGSVGLAVLSQYQRRCAGIGTPMRVVLNPEVSKAFSHRSTGLSIFETVPQALAR